MCPEEKQDIHEAEAKRIMKIDFGFVASDNVINLLYRLIHLELEDVSPEQIAAKNKCCEEVLDWCNKALVFEPESWYWYSRKGEALSYVERYEEAVEAYEESIKRDKDRDPFPQRVDKIIILLALNRFSEAIAECDKGIETQKRFMSEYTNIPIKCYVEYKTKALAGLEGKWFDLGYSQ